MCCNKVLSQSNADLKVASLQWCAHKFFYFIFCLLACHETLFCIYVVSSLFPVLLHLLLIFFCLFILFVFCFFLNQHNDLVHKTLQARIETLSCCPSAIYKRTKLAQVEVNPLLLCLWAFRRGSYRIIILTNEGIRWHHGTRVYEWSTVSVTDTFYAQHFTSALLSYTLFFYCPMILVSHHCGTQLWVFNNAR